MAEQQRPTFPCPKCNRTLRASGVMTLGAVNLPTFQCDECLMTAEFAGESMELPLTFALDADGQPFDPAAPDGRLKLDGQDVPKGGVINDTIEEENTAGGTKSPKRSGQP